MLKQIKGTTKWKEANNQYPSWWGDHRKEGTVEGSVSPGRNWTITTKTVASKVATAFISSPPNTAKSEHKTKSLHYCRQIKGWRRDNSTVKRETIIYNRELQLQWWENLCGFETTTIIAIRRSIRGNLINKSDDSEYRIFLSYLNSCLMRDESESRRPPPGVDVAEVNIQQTICSSNPSILSLFLHTSTKNK